MEKILEILQREFIYIFYFFDIQLRQIFGFWVLGMVIGSAVSVFAKNWIHRCAEFLGEKIPGILGLVFASILGIASPLCMYGTIPICAAFSRKGIKDDFLASFMMSSILLNPQLIIYSAALGIPMLLVRCISCFICGILAGVLVKLWLSHSMRKSGEEKPYFNFNSFDEPKNKDVSPNIIIRFLKNFLRNVKATGPMFLLGIFLSALFQRYVPADFMANLFGSKNEGFGVLMAASIGVPLYVCGGGTIPLLQQWLINGMSAGSAASFMITGPATKITNLGALKIALGAKNFGIYICFTVLFAVVTGLFVNFIL